MAKRRVLILCTGNSCRSQMAEGLWRSLGGETWDVYSAGLTPHGLNPLAVKAMAEIDVDISGQTSDALDPYLAQTWDLIVTVCGNADANCPVFPGSTRKLHWPFDDPAGATGDEEQRMPTFRRVRDEIRAKIADFLANAGA